MMNGYNMLVGMGWLELAAMLFSWIGVMALVLLGLSNLFPSDNTDTESDVLEIVRQRYARGEISREEYLQSVETLQTTGSVTHSR